MQPRTSCVYCGKRTDEQPPNQPGKYRRHPLACWKHVALVELDPSFSPPVDGSVDDFRPGRVYARRVLESVEGAVSAARERAS